jgi:hypothetical protein
MGVTTRSCADAVILGRRSQPEQDRRTRTEPDPAGTPAAARPGPQWDSCAAGPPYGLNMANAFPCILPAERFENPECPGQQQQQVFLKQGLRGSSPASSLTSSSTPSSSTERSRPESGNDPETPPLVRAQPGGTLLEKYCPDWLSVPFRARGPRGAGTAATLTAAWKKLGDPSRKSILGPPTPGWILLGRRSVMD